MAADTYAKGPLWDPDPDKPSLPFIILNTSYSEESNTLFTTSLLFLCVCMHAIYFRLWVVIRNLISRLSLFMVCLYSLVLMPTLSTNLNNSSPPLVFISPEVLTHSNHLPLQLCCAMLNKTCSASLLSQTSHLELYMWFWSPISALISKPPVVELE